MKNKKVGKGKKIMKNTKTAESLAAVERERERERESTIIKNSVRNVRQLTNKDNEKETKCKVKNIWKVCLNYFAQMKIRYKMMCFNE